jgi:hypothetical protein
MVRGEVPSVLTGTGITFCGYCGSPLKAQTMATRRDAAGMIPDANRRLQCTRNNSGERCPAPGSCSVAPIERAIIAYCGDLLNLQRLYQGDAAAAPRAALAAAKARVEALEAQQQRLLDAMMADDTGRPPAAWVQRGHQIAAELASAQAAAIAAEQDLAAVARADVAGADARWRDLADGVLRLDYSARMQARRLVEDTFARLTIWSRGMQPAEAPPGTIDLLMTARGGITRLLRIDRAGRWVAQDDVLAPGSLPA